MEDGSARVQTLRDRLTQAALALDANWPATLAAVQMAASADMVHGLIDNLRDGVVEDDLEAPPAIEQWMGLYDGGLELLSGLGDADPRAFGGTGEDLTGGFRDLAAMGRALRKDGKQIGESINESLKEPEGRRAFQRGFEFWHRFLRMELRKLATQIQSGEMDPGVAEPAGFFSHPAPRFYLTVMLPCLMQYQLTPREVMAGALRGDATMIEILCRVDSRARELPAVADWINYGGPSALRKARRDRVLEWEAGGLRQGKFSEERVKQAIAGFVYAMVRKTGWTIDLKTGKRRRSRIDARLILNLFDAVEQLRTGDPLSSDPDLHDEQFESYSRAVRRWAKRWGSLMPEPRRTKDTG